MRLAPLFLVASSLIALPVEAQIAVDGDTIRLDGETYRLTGIDAPEGRQLCPDGWEAGKAAKAYLEALMAGKSVSCEPETTDRYGRVVALCRADGEDLQAAMVEAGMAWAFVRYSRRYVDNETRARVTSVGVHLHHCQPAWEWRASNRTP